MLHERRKTYAVGYNVRVAVQTPFWDTVLIVASEVPDDEGFVTAAREKHIGATWPSELESAANRRRFTDFSNVVAKLVTHPLWPSRVPRITNCSPILGEESPSESENGVRSSAISLQAASVVPADRGCLICP